MEQAKTLYGVEPVCEITSGYSGNYIFEVKRGTNAYILRVSQYSSEKKNHIDFELKWMRYLAGKMAGIIEPLTSIGNALYEEIEVFSRTYILCLFEKAPGKAVDLNNPQEFSEDLFFRLGALMGDMHRLTREYGGNIRKPQFEWTGSINSWRYDTAIVDECVRLCLKKRYDEINSLPISKDNYGIIHWDIHTDNFFVNKGEIYLFDFGACQFNWYTADIASAIFFLVLKGAGPLTCRNEKERTEFAEVCLNSYLKGYLQTGKISKYWIDKIDLFMKYQMGDEYIFVQSFWPHELAHQRDFYLNWHRERIIKGLPYVFIDYGKVIKSPPLIKE